MMMTARWSALVAVSVMLGGLSAAPRPARGAEPELLSGTPVERGLTAKESHTYALKARANQRFQVVVDQRGVDVVVRLLSPSGSTLLTLDSPNGDQGPENLTWIAAEPGVYRIEVTPLDEPGQTATQDGKYAIHLAEIRAATRAERTEARTAEEIKKRVTAWYQARDKDHVEELKRLAAEDFQGGVGYPFMRNRNELIQLAGSTREQPRPFANQREVSSMQVRSYGDTATVSGRFIWTRRRSGKEARDAYYFSQVWRRQEGEWRLVLDQTAVGEPLVEPPPAARLSEEMLRKYAGRYETNLGMVRIIECKGDRLVYRPTDRADVPGIALYPASETEYFSEDGNSSLVFVHKPGGEVSHVITIFGGRANRLTRLRWATACRKRQVRDGQESAARNAEPRGRRSKDRPPPPRERDLSIHRRRFLSLLLLAAAPFLMPSARAQDPQPRSARWEKEIQAFEEQDRKSPPPAGAALFIGSSSIRGWKTLGKDVSEIPTLNRGFGGSQIEDSTYFAERIVLPYRPRLIVMYAGSNDIAAGKTPARVLADFQAFVAKVRSSLPEVPIAFISINPSVRRWAMQDRMVEANRLIAEWSRAQKRVTYLDSHSAFLGEDGLPRKDLLAADGLHLNPDGYKVWTSVLKPHVLKLYDEAR